MLSKTLSGAVSGIDGLIVRVEVDLGSNGRQLVDQYYSLNTVAPQLAHVFSEIAS